MTTDPSTTDPSPHPAVDPALDGERFQPGRWRLDRAQSRASFTVAHHVLSRVSGALPLVDAHIDVDDAGRPAGLTARLDSAGFTTGHAKRDGHVRGHVYLEADRHPHITFQCDRIEHGAGGWSASGTLTVRDVATPLVLRVSGLARRPDGAVTATATGAFDRFEAGLTKYPTIAVGRRIEVEIAALLHPPAPADPAVDFSTVTARRAS